MTPNEKDWAKKRAMGELKDFVDYTVADPMPLLAGAGTAFVLMTIGTAKLIAIGTGAVVTGVMYKCFRKGSPSRHRAS